MSSQQKNKGHGPQDLPTRTYCHHCSPSNQWCNKRDNIRCHTTQTSMPYRRRKKVYSSEQHPISEWATVIHIWGPWHGAFNDILNGTFQPPPHCDPYAEIPLQALKWPLGIDITPWTQADHISRWRKVWEMTVSSMSNIHFVHYVVGTFNLEIAILNATMANIPLLASYTPKQWPKDLNIML